MNNSKFNFFIGIDVSKDYFHYSIINLNSKIIKQGTLQMDFDGLQKAKNIILQFDNSIIALESTGIYHINLLSFLITFKKQVYLVNPSLIKQFSKSISLRNTKTDKIDANIIANFILKYHSHINIFSISDYAELASLAKIRESIAKDISKFKTKIKQIMVIAFPELSSNFNIFNKSMLHLILHFPTANLMKNASLSEINSIFYKYSKGKALNVKAKLISDLANNSISAASHLTAHNVKYLVEHLLFLMDKLDNITNIFINEINKYKKDDIDIIKSIKGISDVTAAHFIAEIKNIDRFDNRNKLIAFCGTDPSIKQSGSSIYGKSRISKKGSKTLRRTVYLMAMGLIRCNHFFKQYYDKKRNQGFCHRKAMIALCNKLLRVLYSLLKNKQHFDEKIYIYNTKHNKQKLKKVA